jgi:hypothetical protein
MVEGLARVLTRDRAGMSIFEASYNWYVAAYEVLAQVAGIQVETLWRALWQHPCGTVRSALVEEIDDLRASLTAQRLTREQRGRLQALADQAFSATREQDAVGDVGFLRAR